MTIRTSSRVTIASKEDVYPALRTFFWRGPARAALAGLADDAERVGELEARHAGHLGCRAARWASTRSRSTSSSCRRRSCTSSARTALPGRFSHWTHGRAYQQIKTMYDYGLSKIYELVINTEPGLCVPGGHQLGAAE